MPKIKNQLYKDFRENKRMMEEITEQQLEDWLNQIPQLKRPRKCSTEQARAILILLFFTGRRPDEIVDLKPKNIIKVTRGFRHYQLNVNTLKGGKPVSLHWATDKYSDEVFNYMKKFPPEMPCFYAFRKLNKNTVKTMKKETVIVQEIQPDGSITENEVNRVALKSKTYYRKGGLLWYYINLWTGRPPYYFRHYRISEFFVKGGQREEALEFKGGVSDKSLQAYVHQSPKKARRMAQLIKF